MKTDELFPVESVKMDSPRLAWMKKYRIRTFLSMAKDADARCWFAGYAKEIDPDISDADWFCEEMGRHGDLRVGEGTTEDAAIVALARLWKIPLWNEESWLNNSAQPSGVDGATKGIK
jgi:hypothetical protein